MKKVLVALLIVIIVAVLGLGGFIIWQLSKKIDKQNENISTLINEIKGNSKIENINNTATNSIENNNKTNQTVNTNVVNNQTQTANESQTTGVAIGDQVKNAYAKNLSKEENILEYKIDSVTILTDEQKKSIIEFDQGQHYKESDTLAVVKFAVKLKDKSGNYAAGNGKESGDWIVDKISCVVYRNGEIAQEGTSW